MLKYIKYILLVILIILVTHLIILYINYSKENNIYEVNNQDLEKNEFTYELFDNFWYFSKILVYNDKELLNETNVSGNSYIFLKDGYIEYCVSSTDECKKEEYAYINDKIIISFDTLFPKGQYDVKMDGNVLELSKINEGKTIVYVFKCPMG